MRLRTVAVRDLVRKPAEILGRVQNGERLIVCSHRRPVATLQPLNGCVVQPFEGAEYDIYGSALGDAAEEAVKLDEVQRELLVFGQKNGRFVPGRLATRRDFGAINAALDDMALRGLIHKSGGRWHLAGRGWILRETLVGYEDAGAEEFWRQTLSPGTYAWCRRTWVWRLEDGAVIEPGSNQADEPGSNQADKPG